MKPLVYFMEAYIEPGDEYVLNAWTSALSAVNVKVHTDPQSLNREDLCFVYCDYDNYDFEKETELLNGSTLMSTEKP